MNNNHPLISIITVVYNGEEYLEETIQSVIQQTYKNIEYIIIDGGSTDGTVDIIKRYEEKIDYWVSERDDGIYAAMNKGIEMTTGEGLLFLNVGDHFVGEVLSENILVPSFLPVKYYNYFGKLVDVKIKSYKQGIPNSHQGILFENKNIKYDLEYKIASDYDFYLKHGYKNLPIAKISGYIYYDNEGFSKINFIHRDREIMAIIGKNFGLLAFVYFKMKVKLKNIFREYIL